MQLTVASNNETETEALGQRLGRLLLPGDVVALVGDLGAGKTSLTRGIARGLGVAEPVTSPTFILIAEYDTPSGFRLYHADCYRFGDAPAEAQGIGLDELLDSDGVCVIEWAERISGLLPADHLRIEIDHAGQSRRILTLRGLGPRSRELIQAMDLKIPA